MKNSPQDYALAVYRSGGAINHSLHLLPDAGDFFKKELQYTCRQMRLEVVRFLIDEVGKYGAILQDNQRRKYVWGCKRYIFWRNIPTMYGVVSFTKKIVFDAYSLGYTLLMTIEDKDDSGEARNYIYTFNPGQILNDCKSYDNSFNDQIMFNIDITWAINMEPSRRREIQEARVNLLPKGTTRKEKSLLEVLRMKK